MGTLSSLGSREDYVILDWCERICNKASTMVRYSTLRYLFRLCLSTEKLVCHLYNNVLKCPQEHKDIRLKFVNLPRKADSVHGRCTSDRGTSDLSNRNQRITGMRTDLIRLHWFGNRLNPVAPVSELELN